MQPTEEQRPAVESADPCILVTARPGRGKTAVALMFAREVVRRGEVGPAQQVLFLTFSRNAVYQIEQASASDQILDAESRKQVRVATYHSFMWWLIQAFGRYNGLPRELEWMGSTRAKLCRQLIGEGSAGRDDLPALLARTFGCASYGMFAPLALNLLRRSEFLRGSLQRMYPVVVVDEFQDTNDEQWELVKLVSERSRLMCLADPDQMIFRSFGASTDRLGQLVSERSAVQYSFTRCLRTDNHDLLDFAETILDAKSVSGDLARRYVQRFLSGYQHANALGPWLKGTICRFQRDFRRRRRNDAYPSVAVAAHSNAWASKLRSMLQKSTPKGPAVYRCALIGIDDDDALESLVIRLAQWASGHDSADLAASLHLAVGILTDATVPGTSLARLLRSDGEDLQQSTLRGVARDIAAEFLSLGQAPVGSATDAVRNALAAVRSLANRSRAIADAMPGEELSSSESVIFRALAECPASPAPLALQILKRRLSAARVQQCVLERVQPMRGLVSSTMHKLKGKEFDYVCIVTMAGDPLRSSGESEQDARRLMYVALTRSRYDARVFYMSQKPCSLLEPFLATARRGDSPYVA